MPPVTWTTALQTIGFSLAAANAIITDQGVTLDDMSSLEERDITIICQAIRRPGGEITRGSRRVPNPGTNVNALAEKRLKLVRFMVEHFTFGINRTLTPAMITIVALNEMAQLQTIFASYKEPNENSSIEDHETMCKFLTSVGDTLTPFLGCKKVPLTYLLRANVEPILEVNDPRTNYANR